MAINLDSNQKYLLAQLGEILQDPALPTLLQRMSSQEPLWTPEEPLLLSTSPLFSWINPQKGTCQHHQET